MFCLSGALCVSVCMYAIGRECKCRICQRGLSHCVPLENTLGLDSMGACTL